MSTNTPSAGAEQRLKDLAQASLVRQLRSAYVEAVPAGNLLFEWHLPCSGGRNPEVLRTHRR